MVRCKTEIVTIVAAMAFLAVSAGSVQGGTITVGPGGGYDFSSIQAAINAAGTGDTVIVAQGRYCENINFNGKSIIVTSSDPNDPAIVASTIIDANGLGGVVTFENAEGPDAVITGFTITGGIGTYDNRVIDDGYYGGGVYCYYASPTITCNVISGNIGLNDDEETINTRGGGICCVSSNAIIARNVIKENEAYYGGGIYIQDVGDVGANVTITSNVITGNESSEGAGIGVFSGDAMIANSLMCGNSAEVLGGGIYLCYDTNVVIIDCILWANLPSQADGWPDQSNILSITYSDVESGWLGEGNIKEDPLFLDAANGDYHLQVDSPCINAGDPGFVPQPDETDFDGNPRILLGRVDIGPYDMPGQVTLDGSSSSDPDNDPLTYHWQQTFGPGVEIDDANSAITMFSPAEYGGYVFELVVIVVGSRNVPVADAGSSRYAGTDPVQLDGTGSYDPDNSGPLSYQWQQISGPNLTITGADTPTPTISGFTPTDSIQRCEFQLIVNDGEYDSLPGAVYVIIVHNCYSQSSFRLENGTFDPEKPTIIHFGRGGSWAGGSDWNSRANILSEEYDSFDTLACGDQIITYLSSVAPNYSQSIQMSGNSAGSWQSRRVAIYLNTIYQDRRYAVNRLSIFDNNVSFKGIFSFLASAIDEEQCWMDNYVDEYGNFKFSLLNVDMKQFPHCGSHTWYKNSLTYSDLNQFTSPVAGPGVVAGAYWSVIGPGKNLQLARTPDSCTYDFKWYGDHTSGYMVLDPNCTICGKLPEPVTLINPVAGGTTDPNPAPGLLTCEESENAVGYQLLMGPDPYRVMDYNVISDTPYPPNSVITTFPFEHTWWTVKARDHYGSTIYADPVHISSFILTRPIEPEYGKKIRLYSACHQRGRPR
ncbi:MAG: PKD domain-containing protein [Planctomycetota bacterium]|jgi:hypothetical protein